jgi:26S proteasome regulatory subunit (ATPase 3-interacting protein)
MTGNELSTEETIILEYLMMQNRPYSATDIFNNLHGTVRKNGVSKILSNLHEKGIINGKAYGKQWVFASKHVILVGLMH